MEVVTGATSSLLPKLAALLQEEYKLQKSLRKDVESLQYELAFMNATLRMLAEAPPEQLDEQVKAWGSFIKNISYDMEDAVDTFIARVEDRKHANLRGFRGFFKKVVNMFLMSNTHHEIAEMIQDIKSLPKEVTELRDRYRLNDVETFRTSKDAARRWHADQMEVSYTTTYAVDSMLTTQGAICFDKLVGLEKDRNKLCQWVTSSEVGHSVLCIVGSGGVGKTTVAMALYRKLGIQFDCRAMVNVSASFYLERILRVILAQVKPHANTCEDQQPGNDSKTVAEYITQELKSHLERNSYFLVIDDVCSVTVWEQIRYYLTCIGQLSRIIVTTRFRGVATACTKKKDDLIHNIHVLCEEESEELFVDILNRER